MGFAQRMGRGVARLRSRRDRDPTGTMTLVEHLSELRSRLINSILAVGAGSVIGWFLFQPVFDLLRHPYCTVIKAHPTLYPFGNPSNCALAYTSPIGPFVVKIKIVTFLGLAIALPIVLCQACRHRGDRRVRGHHHAHAGLVHQPGHHRAVGYLLRAVDPGGPLRPEEVAAPFPPGPVTDPGAKSGGPCGPPLFAPQWSPSQA